GGRPRPGGRARARARTVLGCGRDLEDARPDLGRRRAGDLRGLPVRPGREIGGGAIGKEGDVKRASWIIVSVAAGLTLLGGLASLSNAYFSGQERIAGRTLQELAGGDADV